jgi:hypothetical protein
MMNRRASIIILLLCAAAFGFGLLRLFALRFEAGDVYPPYSSLRSDPLGTMAFCESLEKVPGLSVRRDFSSDNRLPEEPGTVYLHLAAKTSAWKQMPADLLKEIEGFLARGGRLAVTFLPEISKPSRLFELHEPDDSEKSSADKKKKKNTNPIRPAKKKQSDVEEDQLLRSTSLKERWGLDFGFLALEPADGSGFDSDQATNSSGLPLPDSLAWHSATVFTNLNHEWRTVYARGTNPVVIERAFGSGTVVMATDSFFLSNEAMLTDRHAEVLAWLIGPARRVVFDESHLGIVETSGVATLVRKYHLHGLVAGLVVLAGLFIWKNSLSFVPPYAEEKLHDYVTGKEVAAGFVNLLRRNVPSRDVLGICFAEWKKSFARGSKFSTAKVAQAEALMQDANAQSDPLVTYQQISKILNKTGLIKP